MPEVPEYVVNVKLAEILSRELGIDARAERVKSRKRLDIRCYYRGLIIGVEASYDSSDAESDAEKRIEQGLVDIALALWIKQPYKDMPEQQLYEEIKRSRFHVKIFVPREAAGALIPFIERRIRKKAEPATRWFRDVDLPTLKTIIENCVELLAREEEVAKLLSEVRGKVKDFIETLRALDSRGAIRRNIYDVLYRLYGLSVAEAEEPEVAFGHAALSILLSATFYERIRASHPELKPLPKHVRSYGPIEGLRKALEDLLRIDYRTVIEVTLNIINALPPSAGYRVKVLIDLGVKLASSSSLLRKDFAGRVYHEITGNIALRKGFATFYTEVPAAYMLASLTVQSLLDLNTKNLLELTKEEARRIVDRITSIRVGDLACGSGTLLTASYSALMRVATILKYYCDLEDVDLEASGRSLIENGIYGIDALRYASQITAINLALIGPGVIDRENVFTIYLGYIPEKRQAWLGSLELLNNTEKVGGLLAYIEGELKGVAERVDVEGTEGTFSIPREFDMIIMNPPFTRATGRTERFGEGRGLFGFVLDEGIRKNLVDAYNRVRDRVRRELRSIAEADKKIFPNIVQEIISGRQELSSYLNIGQVGEGLLFLYLAYRYIKDGGVIAFVLPRGLLAGVSWFLARVLLASKFHVKYVVVSSDPGKGYNFSEGTSLSEALVVAKRVSSHGHDEETVFINLLKKSSTALEALVLAEEVKRRASALPIGGAELVSVGGSEALLLKIGRSRLLENIDNWNRFVALPDPELVKAATSLLKDGEIALGDYRVRIPLTRFNTLIDKLGIDRHQFRDNFSSTTTRTPYPIIYGGGEKVRSRIMVRPNSYAVPRNDRASQIFREYASRILVPDRIWWDTAHAIALYSEEPVLSNIFYAVKLKADESIKDIAEKALALWLNTTWGALTILFSRQETRGRWAQLKMAQWRLLPVLEVSKLDHGLLRRFVEVFEKYVDKPLRRIPEQFDPRNPDPVRLGIDIDFLKAIDPSLDSSKVKESLLELYNHIHEALRLWIGD